MKRLLGLTRLIAVLGVVSSLILSFLMFLFVAVRTFVLAKESLQHISEAKTGKNLLVASIEQADALLVATALLVIGFGLYSLFVGKIDSIPSFLEVKSFTDLKDKLVNVSVVALVVAFFSLVIEHLNDWGVLEVGAGIGAVVLAVSVYGFVNGKSKETEQELEKEQP
ncbi:YqhA family protein [Deinococcus roseus]|uniref:YqhA family protein n=1 Tax=Deinococcus roseus TaxID=392414 RepID=A0ABQ2D0C2_9DEIO|nr:YqhA family protein [Deinococcus roseus]GGJ38557.1 hypothetical protein GCM10008938_25840 [Deinococcus roseus]